MQFNKKSNRLKKLTQHCRYFADKNPQFPTVSVVSCNVYYMSQAIYQYIYIQAKNCSKNLLINIISVQLKTN